MNKMSKTLQLIFTALLSLLLSSSRVVNGQISTPCTLSMITSFTPCLNFVTGSSNNGTSLTRSCCSSMKVIMETGMNCVCLLVTANVPLQLPINRTLALSLPRACNMNVPLQCKPSGSPIPAPGIVILPGPSLPPSTAASPFSPRASKVLAAAPEPQFEATEQPIPAPAPQEESNGSNGAATIHPVLSPPITNSVSSKTFTLPSPLQLIFIVALAFKTISFSMFIS